MPGLKIVLDTADKQHVFGFMTSNESLEFDSFLSISPFVLDVQRLRSLIVFFYRFYR